jgi:hypothetical protein
MHAAQRNIAGLLERPGSEQKCVADLDQKRVHAAVQTKSDAQHLRKNPHAAIGRQVEKLFRGKYFMGVVIDTDFDTDTNETIWAVRHDDGDVEDLNAKELAAVLHDDEAGITTRNNANAGQSTRWNYHAAPHDHTPERKKPIEGPFSFRPAHGDRPIDAKMFWRGFVLW